MGETGLYDSAAVHDRQLRPLWHVGDKRMLFAGCLGRNALHTHSATVLLAGVYDEFSLRLKDSDWLSCRAAIIRAGTAYEFDARGQPLSVIYVEPDEIGAEGLGSLLRDTSELSGAVVGAFLERRSIRAIYEDSASACWAGEAVTDLVRFAQRQCSRVLDRRIRAALQGMTAGHGAEYEGTSALPPRVSSAAIASELSVSRFQHLFREHVGVSYNRYSAWRRMRTAIAEVVRGTNLTAAAHAAGYYDQPHFSREFRRIFGAPASKSLSNVRS